MSLNNLFRPKTRTELVGNQKAISKLEDCIMSSRVAIIDGTPGIGKTTACHVLANDMGWQVREWNASDARRKDDFITIKRELKGKSFSPTIFVLDEIDGAVKKGDLDANCIIDCIKNTKNGAKSRVKIRFFQSRKFSINVF